MLSGFALSSAGRGYREGSDRLCMRESLARRSLDAVTAARTPRENRESQKHMASWASDGVRRVL